MVKSAMTETVPYSGLKLILADELNWTELQFVDFSSLTSRTAAKSTSWRWRAR